MIKQVSYEMKMRICTEPKWIFLLFSIASMHLDSYFCTTYAMLWLDSFIETGEIKDEKDAEKMIVMISMISIPFVMAGIIVSGLLSDRI